MGNLCKPCWCTPKIPEVRINVNSNCCRDNRNLKIVVHDPDDFEKVKDMINEIHRLSLKKNAIPLQRYCTNSV